VVPPVLPLPPVGYAGTERVVSSLVLELHRRGHEITVFGAGDSRLPCEVVPVVPTSLWATGRHGDLSSYFHLTVARAWEQQERFDIIHSNIETTGFAMARHAITPVVTTLHGRLDVGGTSDLIDAYPDIPLIAISKSQRRWNEDASWIATIPHGVAFSDVRSTTPGDYLLLVGRLTREKGVAEAIALARRTRRRLVIAAKAHERSEVDMFTDVVRPAIDDGVVDWRGEVDTEERDRLMAGALATVMLGSWPEPFGLVAVESMATGTPVIARRAGAYTETVEHGMTGFLIDDEDEAVLAVERVADLDRRRIGARARTVFGRDHGDSLRGGVPLRRRSRAARNGEPWTTPSATSRHRADGGDLGRATMSRRSALDPRVGRMARAGRRLGCERTEAPVSAGGRPLTGAGVTSASPSSSGRRQPYRTDAASPTAAVISPQPRRNTAYCNGPAMRVGR
jgi:glycosyltransferase involved in cell wall biosynthesis